MRLLIAAAIVVLAAGLGAEAYSAYQVGRYNDVAVYFMSLGFLIVATWGMMNKK